MNYTGCVRRRLWPNFELFSRVYQEGLAKTTKNLSQDGRRPSRQSVSWLLFEPTWSISVVYTVTIVYPQFARGFQHYACVQLQTKLRGQQADVVQNCENEHAPGKGQGTARQKI
jgi:hypothetical protein